jgi:CRISPR-associated Csx14 family protein
MAHIYLATLGTRPQAITVAFDLLNERYHFAEVVVLHTEPHQSEIARALHDLKPAFSREFPGVHSRYVEITRRNGSPLLDIQDQETAKDYWKGVTDILSEYQRDYNLHLMIAGGRKAMSVYAALAAGLFFRPRDRVWTVLSPESMLVGGIWRAPAGMRDQVQIVELPVFPVERSQELRALIGDLDSLLAARHNSRSEFLARLSPAEKRLVELIQQHRHETSKHLGVILNKSEKTIDNQFASIYDKLADHVDLPEGTRYRRQALLDFLDERSE